MRVIAKVKRIKELWCVLFGHEWMEYGCKTCETHKNTFDEYNTCNRCGLEYHTQKCCDDCYRDFQDTFMGDKRKAQQA